MDGIAALVRNLVRDYQPVPGWEVQFPSDREAVSPCFRCGCAVTGSKKGFFCDNRDCRFALWKDSKFFSAKKKSLTKSVAAALLEGRAGAAYRLFLRENQQDLRCRCYFGG